MFSRSKGSFPDEELPLRVFTIGSGEPYRSRIQTAGMLSAATVPDSARRSRPSS